MMHPSSPSAFSKTVNRRISCLFATTNGRQNSTGSRKDNHKKTYSRGNVTTHNKQKETPRRDTDNQNDDAMDFSTKNRSKELKRLASIMNIEDGEQLKELLRGQRSKMNHGDDKRVAYIDWLLEDNNHASTTKNKKKRPRKSSTSEGLPITKTKTNDDDDNLMMGVKDDSIMQEKKQMGKDLKNSDPTQKKKKTAIIRPRRKSATTTTNVQEEETSHRDQEETAESTVLFDPSLLSDAQFKDAVIHANTKKALEKVLKLQSLTEVQSKSLGPAMAGTDILARARTGTGKTLAFLIPALERLLANKNYNPGKSVGVLVISPTRELASQIGDQAEKLITFHSGLSCQVMYGGTKMGRDVTTLNKHLPSFLIATPGRLLDHMENTKLQNGKKFGYDIMRQTQILVLDEADRLLDMGFRTEINKIMTFLPKKDKRQTLLFSATVPKELKSIIAENMKDNFQEIDCIRNADDASNAENHTNILVQQTFAILPSLDQQVTAVVQLIQKEMKSDPKHKIVVFFPTARMVQYFAEFFNVGLGMDVIELHSKKTQGYRNKASEKFRQAKTGVLFTSDVSARGVDYPDVTRVIQFGLPESREQYIHRLGRTGRAGKEGQGILVLAPFEKKFLGELKDIDITENKKVTKLISADNNMVDTKLSESIDKVLSRIRSGDARLTVSAEQCYQSYIGYYNGHLKRTTLRSKHILVETANAFAKTMGLKEQPGLTKRAVSKMGLRDVKNIRIVSEAEARAKKRI